MRLISLENSPAKLNNKATLITNKDIKATVELLNDLTITNINQISKSTFSSTISLARIKATTNNNVSTSSQDTTTGVFTTATLQAMWWQD